MSLVRAWAAAGPLVATRTSSWNPASSVCSRMYSATLARSRINPVAALAASAPNSWDITPARSTCGILASPSARRSSTVAGASPIASTSSGFSWIVANPLAVVVFTFAVCIRSQMIFMAVEAISGDDFSRITANWARASPIGITLETPWTLGANAAKSGAWSGVPLNTLCTARVTFSRFSAFLSWPVAANNAAYACVIWRAWPGSALVALIVCSIRSRPAPVPEATSNPCETISSAVPWATANPTPVLAAIPCSRAWASCPCAADNPPWTRSLRISSS